MSRLGFFLLASLLALPAPAQESPTTQDVAPQAGPTATVDQSPSSQVLTLDEVVSEALAKNPGVQSAAAHRRGASGTKSRKPRACLIPTSL